MEGASSTDNMHNEEKNSRIPYDQVDRDILRKKMEVSLTSLMPLSTETG